MITNETGIKFEIMRPYESINLIAIREPNKYGIFGYVQLIPDIGWVWYSSAIFSNGFNTYDEAIEDLLQKYVMNSMNNTAKSIGVYDDENYTKGK